MQASEWEWRRLEPEEHEILRSSDIHGVYALGQLWAVIALLQPDDEGDSGQGRVWMYYTAPDPEDAWNGYEPIEGFATLEEAKEAVDADREQVLQQLRDGN